MYMLERILWFSHSRWKKDTCTDSHLSRKVWILSFPAFCFWCHHYFIHGFRISTCVICAVLVMCLLLSAPDYVQMQLYRQPPEQKVWISTFCSFVYTNEQYSISIYIGTLYISSTMVLKCLCLSSRQYYGPAIDIIVHLYILCVLVVW